MRLIAPKYYKDFKCIADECQHSCCIGWRISVDRESEEKYSLLCGEYAENVKSSLLRDSEGAYLRRTDCGKCVHLDERGLCKIYINFGEEMLSDICREHPRFYNRIGEDIAVGIGPSCPAAARLLLDGEHSLLTEVIGEIDSDLPERYPVKLLSDRLASISTTAKDSDELESAILSEIGAPKSLVDLSSYSDTFSELEYLYPENRDRILSALTEPSLSDINTESRLFTYFLYRHLPEAECKTDADAIILFSLISAKIILSMGSFGGVEGALIAYSEEIEYSPENKDAVISEISFGLI